MKNTLNQSIVSNPIPAAISSQHACYLLFFLDNRCEIAALKKQFALTPLQVVEFLTSKSVRAAIEEMHETIRASLAVQALKARDFAMDKLKIVCTDLIRQTTITAGIPINETAHAKAINHLRLATSQLGRFAAAAISPPKTPRTAKAPTHAEHLVPNVLNPLSTSPNLDLVANTHLSRAARNFDSGSEVLPNDMTPANVMQIPASKIKEACPA